jgi:ribosomal protein L12E/L44/L45/RPP1/RPP2
VDANHDGTITQDELAKVMTAANVSASPEDIAALFAQLDQNRDGAISLNEFVSGMKRLNKAVLMTGRLNEATQRQREADPRAARLAELCEERNSILLRVCD